MKSKIIMLSLALVTLTLNSYAHDFDLFLKLTDAEIGLAEKRSEILNNYLIQVGKYKNNFTQKNSTLFALSHKTEDLEINENKIRKFRALKEAIKSQNKNSSDLVSSITSNFSAYTEKNLEVCLSILTAQNITKASLIQDQNQEIEILDWNRYSFYKNDVSSNAGLNPINALYRLYSQNFACQREIGNYQGEVSTNYTQLGACFASAYLEYLGKDLKKIDYSVSLDTAYLNDATLDVPNDKMKKFEDFILKHADYQLLPQELLRLNRSRLEITRKLFDLRGDRSIGGDNAGDWYHLFGVAKATLLFGDFPEVGHMAGGCMQVLSGARDIVCGNPLPDMKEIKNDDGGVTLIKSMKAEISLYSMYQEMKEKDPGYTTTRELKSSLQECGIHNIFQYH